MMTYDIAGVAVSRETYEELQAFEELARKWTVKINLIAPSTIDDLWERHIVDSAQLWKLVPDNAQSWVDIGSGGGFPGIVLAIMAKEFRPQMAFTLIESDQRKCAFLRTAARELGLNVKVLSERVEKVAPLQADGMSARALAALDVLLGFADRHLNAQAVAIFPKGRAYEGEVEQARQSWQFSLEIFDSMTDPDARILRLERMTRA